MPNSKQMNNITFDRIKYNSAIIKLIENYLSKYPDLRFNQLMYILNGTDDFFNEEPKQTYSRFYKKLNEENGQ